MLKDHLLYWFHHLFRPESLENKEWLMWKLLNDDRKFHGLKSLAMQNDLRLVARAHSNQMAEQDFFAHVDPQNRDPGDRIRGAGITDVAFGENLAKMRGFDDVTEEAEKALMKSPGHRANILTASFNCVGVGVIKAKDETFYFTQNFARRFLRLNTRKKYYKCNRPLIFWPSTLETFSQMALQEKYEKPFSFHYTVQGNKVRLELTLLERGRYEFEILVQPMDEKKYYISNVLHLRAYSNIFDRFLV
ncbi:MAG: CAP domain-containing protein [Candidatus Abawacabacteria bacterium]|nr:CAP domain-containing protein [Candidatus Abawacabacteria bacterium]